MDIETQRIIDRIESQAKTNGLDLDTVRVIDSSTDEPTFRVLHTDAENERDQIGFQITHPSGPLSDQMFSNQLSDYLSELKRTVQSDVDTDSDTGSEPMPLPDATEDEEDEDSVPMEENESIPRSVKKPTSFNQIEVTVSMDDDELSNKVETTLEELIEPLADTIADTENEVEDIDERLSALEETLGQVGQK